MRILVVDGANVVGSRPDGWWRDRPGAARRLAEALETAQLPYDEVVLVLEGAARRGRPEGHEQGLHVEHADGNGDDAIVDEVARRVPNGANVEVVTADRELRSRVAVAGGTSLGPSWLLEQL
ncbi:MAG: hypothetical protein ABJA81_10730 [Nocardioidaceae bacterium]